MQFRKFALGLGLLLATLFSLPTYASVDNVNVTEQPDKGTLYPVGSSFVSGQSNGKKFISATNNVQESLKATQNPNHLPATGGNSPTSFSYGRGVGTIPTHCPSGWSDVAGLCAKDCPAGYSSVAGVCWQQCPTNYTDMGATCTWWKLWPHTFAKKSWIQERKLRECAPGEENDAGLCYKQCAIGYNGVGPVCWTTLEHFATSRQRVKDTAQAQQNAYQKPSGINIAEGQAPVLKTDLQFTHIVCALEESEGAFGLPVPGIADLVATGVGAGVGAIKPGAWFDASLSDAVVLDFTGGATCNDDGTVATATMNFHPSITVQATTKMFDPALHNLAGVDLGIAKVSVYELIPFRIYGAVGTTLGVDTTISSTIDRREPGFFVEGRQYATKSKLEVEPEVDFWLSLDTYFRVTSIVSFIPDLVQLGAEFKLFVLELDLPYVLEEGIRTVNSATELFKTESLKLELEAGRGYIDTYLKVLGINLNVFPENADLKWNGHQETHTLFERQSAQAIQVSAPTQAAPKPEDTFRELKNAKTGLCMDVAGGNNANGTNVQQWQCNGSDAQKWKYDAANGYLRNKMGRCLDNTGNTANNGNIQIWDCVDSNNLRFDWVGNTLRSRHNNNIAVDGYGSSNGANVGQWTHHGGTNQQWNWGS